MTLVRERRQQQALRLILPPLSLSPRALSPSPLSSSSSNSSGNTNSLSSPPGLNNLFDLKKLCILGRGNGGTVYKVCHKQTGLVYALKVVRFGENEDDVVREAEALQRVGSSEYVVRCYGVFDGGGVGLCFVMEYMDVGSLHDILCNHKKLSEGVISCIMRSVLKGLHHVHGKEVVHGDIKPSNILANARGKVKIADFGASRFLTSSNYDHKKTCTSGSHESCGGTCAYMSPERLDPDRWDGEWCNGFVGDVWSVGVVAMECYVGRFPLVGSGQKPDWVTLMCAICFGENVDSMLRNASPKFQSFCKRCLERDWRKRGTVEELLAHPFLNQSEINGVEDIIAHIASID